MEHIDYVAARTAIAGLTGGLCGISVAIFRGHSILMLSSRMAGTWAMAATACIGSQRLCCVASRYLLQPSDEKSDAMLVGTHITGGLTGGGLLGYLYLRKPMRGVIFFAPIMFMLSLAEILYEEQKRLGSNSVVDQIKATRTFDGGIIEEEKSTIRGAKDDVTQEEITTAAED